MSLRLDFLNRNTFRNYPMGSYSDMKTIQGNAVPLGLFAGLQLTTVYGKHQAYISHIVVSNNYINVTVTDNLTNTPLGSFAGIITDTFQVIQLYPFVSYISGSLTIGNVSALDELQGIFDLDYANGRIEDSLVFCFTPPPLISFQDIDGHKATGNVLVTGDNVTVTAVTNGITLGVTDTTLVQARADFSSTLGNCPTPYITHLNNVTPDGSGNIDIYSILPLTITVGSGGTGQLAVSTGTMTLAELCQARNIRLAPVNASDAYYTDLFTATQPEWKTW